MDIIGAIRSKKELLLLVVTNFDRQKVSRCSFDFICTHPLFTSRDQFVGKINQRYCRLLSFCRQTNTLPLVKTGHVTYIVDVCRPIECQLRQAGRWSYKAMFLTLNRIKQYNNDWHKISVTTRCMLRATRSMTVTISKTIQDYTAV